MQITTWNTKRQYSDKGQRISATILDCGKVMFADVDRGIDGVTVAVYDECMQCIMDIKEYVMMEYDHGRITYGSWDYKESQGMSYNGSAAFYQKRDSIMDKLKTAAKAI